MTDSKIREADGGLYLPVRVQPRAKREEIVGFKEGTLHIRLTAPPVEGAANERLLEMVAELFGLPKTSLRLTAGLKGRNKTIFLPGKTLEDVTAILGVGKLPV